MFEYLPVVSFKDGFEMVKKDVPYFERVVQQCVERTKIGNEVRMLEVINCACHELNQCNPLLGAAVMAGTTALATILMNDVTEKEAWISALASLTGELAILCLIDRALEVRKTEKGAVAKFEHLPVITDADVKVNREKDFPYFRKLVQQCVKRTDAGSEMVEYACDELTEHSPGLGVAVEGYAEAMAIGLEHNVESRVAWANTLGQVGCVLPILRLIDRALESKGVGEKLKGS
jgi:hypothetical protein